MEHSLLIDAALHITDIHFWRAVWNPLRLLNKRFLGNLNAVLRRGRHILMEQAEPYTEVLAATGVRTILITGDFTCTATDEEFALARAFLERLQGLGLDIHILSGNHDAYTFESCRRHRFEAYLGSFSPATALPARITLPGGTPLLFIPTVTPNWLTSRGRIQEMALEQLGSLLQDCGPAVLVAGHYPALHDTASYHSAWTRRLAGADALRTVLGDSSKHILYLAGHVHRFSYMQDPVYPNISHLTTGAFLYKRPSAGTHGEFSRIEVFPQRFAITRHVKRAKWECESADSHLAVT